MGILAWWDALSLATQIFYAIAIPATLILLIQTVMLFLGIGEDGDADADVPDTDADLGFDADVDGEIIDTSVSDGVFGDNDAAEAYDAAGVDFLRIFTLRGIVAFAVVFGWVGAAMSSAGASLAVTIPVAFVCGFAMMLAIAMLLRAVMKLRASGNTDNRNAIGVSGRVYLTVPPFRTGEGKVQVLLQGSLVERGAVTDEEIAIPTGAEIVVVGISGQTDLVVKRK